MKPTGASLRVGMLRTTAASVLALVVAGAASAQSTNPPSAAPAPGQVPGNEVSREPNTGEIRGAEAQDGGDEIVVTGFRQALATSVATKRESNQIVESISAEDIGKLPDNSIAESIARLSGITTQRLDGRAQVISIRGLAPDFASTLLNGREQVTTGDNRGVEFDQYPSELLGGVDVYKTPFAGLIGQGLSGTVNLKTIRPLDYGRTTLAANVRGEMVDTGALNSGTSDKGWRASATYIDQFADNTIGILLGVAHLDSPTQFERFNAWGYPTFDRGSRPEYASPAYDAAVGARIIGGAKPYVQSNTLERTGVVAALEFQPTEALHVIFDGYYSRFKDSQLLRGIEFPLFWGNATLAPGFTVEDGIVTSGTWTNVKPVVRNDYNLREADLWSGGVNLSYEFGGGFRFIGDASYSRVDREDNVVETYSGTSRGAGNGPFDTLGFEFAGEQGYRFTPTLNYADPSVIRLTSPQGWGDNNVPGGQDGFVNNPSIKDELAAFRASVQYDVPSGGLVEVGANYTTRNKRLDLERFFLGLTANAGNTGVSVPVPENLRLRPTRLGYLGIPGMLSYDPVALVASGIYNLNPARDDDVFAFGWRVKEDVVTGYARYDIDATMANGGTLTGNAGVQVIYTDQSSTGAAAAGSPVAQVTQVTGGDTYTDVLPSFSLVARMPTDWVVRVGVARQVARPRLDQMRASINFDYDPSRAGNTAINLSPFSGGGGNPNLRPWIASAVDLSVEKYFGRESYIQGAVFYKYLESYIFDQAAVYDFSGFPITGGIEPVLRQGIVTIPQNGSGGTLYGAEGSFAFAFGTVTDALEGFGLLGSASYTQSSIRPNPSDPTQRLPGLSDWVANGTLFFEKNGFSTRASVRYRSSFLAELSGVGTERIQREANGEVVVDAQIGYEFQNGPLTGLGILAQAQNLTDEPFSTFEGGDRQLVRDWQRYGRRFLVGVSYRFF